MDPNPACLVSVAGDFISVARLMLQTNENMHSVKRKHQTDHMKAVSISLRLTCYKLREELVVAVDDIDRHISGGLQEQRPALQSNGQIFNTFMLTVAY